MILVADESVEGPAVAMLRAAGHAVFFVAGISPGIEDSNVLFRSRLSHCGVFLIRSLGDNPEESAANSLAETFPEWIGVIRALLRPGRPGVADQNRPNRPAVVALPPALRWIFLTISGSS